MGKITSDNSTDSIKIKTNKSSKVQKNEFTRATMDNTINIIYEYIVKFFNDEGYPPSVRDICAGTGIKSTSTVHSHIKRLKTSGKLDYVSGRRRAISINDSHSKADIAIDNTIIQIPLLGVITAGAPILAQENIERTLPFSIDFFKGKNDIFILEVRGDSMMDAAILNGDYVIVQRQSAARFGDIIVALIGDEATVKTLIKFDGKTYLRPENEKYDLIPFFDENCQIIGKVISVFRPTV